MEASTKQTETIIDFEQGVIFLTATGAALYWLPLPQQWPQQLARLQANAAPTLADFSTLACLRLDFSQLNSLDRLLQRARHRQQISLPKAHERLAILASSTTTHLHAGVRFAGLRRGLWLDIYQAAYGQFWQTLMAPDDALTEFAPTTAVLALDANELASGLPADCDRTRRDCLLQSTVKRLQQAWRSLRSRYGCQVIQQLPLPVFENLMGNNEHCLPGSRADYLYRLNAAIRDCAAEEGVDILSLDRQVTRDGLAAWHDPRLWLHGRMEILPQAAPLFGELLLRLIAARQGRSAKCLVLDLDNTLWGGEVGEVGLNGIALGQGSAEGEAFQNFQRYLLELNQRGVVLAVCSKNNHGNAYEVFESHPEMILKPQHIASFRANWNIKPDNVRDIAEELNIGVESMVFIDDSAFERALMRRALATVQTPEMPDDPALLPRLLADAGYFESVAVTADDRHRNAAYQANSQRLALRDQHEDLATYLGDLDMNLTWQAFSQLDLERVVQLMKKTNQFNLTTPRYNRDQVAAMMADSNMFTLQFRLRDCFGDNGLIAIVIARQEKAESLLIDTFLMSCRVLGRRVEHAILNVLADTAQAAGVRRIIGEYRATPKNSIVRELYPRLGFKPLATQLDDVLQFELSLNAFRPFSVPTTICKAES